MKLKKIMASMMSVLMLFNLTTVNANSLMYGDADSDSILTANDAAKVLQYVLNSSAVEMSQEELIKSDVDGTPGLSASDAVAILQKVLNNSFVFSVNDNTESTTVEIIESTTAEVVETTTAETTEPTTAEAIETTTAEATESTTAEVIETTTVETTETTTAEYYISLEDNNSKAYYYIDSTIGNELENQDYVYIENNRINILNPGVYYVSGTLTDGQIVVNSPADLEVVLLGVDITSSVGSPLYTLSGDLDLKLQKGYENKLTDASVYTDIDESSEPDACLFTKDRLTIKGKGTLYVTGNAGDGIASKDELKINNGNVYVTAADDAIRGKDYISITGGTINTTSVGTGIKSTSGYVLINEESNSVNITVNSSKNGIQGSTYVQIDAGTVNVTAVDKGVFAQEENILINGGTIDCTLIGTDTTNYDYDAIKSKVASVIITGGDITTNVTMDAISAETDLTISGGTFNLTSGDNGISSATTGVNITGGEFVINSVGKGIKAETALVIDNGSFNITSTDDAIHSNDSVTINNGTYTISTGDDAVHGDGISTVNNGTFDILKSYEGIEGTEVVINGGNINITSSDDGVNSAGGNDSSGMGGNDATDTWGPGSNTGNTTSGGCNITINGGYVYVNSTGDGIDSNGNTYFNGGTVIVQGPPSGADTAIDADGSIFCNGSTLLAIGTTGMVVSPSTSSQCYSVVCTNSVNANTILAFTDGNGQLLSALNTIKSSSSIIYSSPELTSGSQLNIYIGGSVSGNTDENGYTDEGTYTAGTSLASTTLSSKVTSIGSSSSSGGRF